MKKMIFILITLLLLNGFSLSADTESDEPSALQEELMQLGFRVFKQQVEAPDFELENLKGETVTLSSFRGNLVFLNFWATWCPPCREEMPSMQTLYEKLEDEDFEIVAVDLQESRRTVADFIEERGFTFPVVIDSSGRTGSEYGARSIPTSYLIDRDGNAIGFLVGSRMWDGEDVEQVFRSLLED